MLHSTAYNVELNISEAMTAGIFILSYLRHRVCRGAVLFSTNTIPASSSFFDFTPIKSGAGIARAAEQFSSENLVFLAEILKAVKTFLEHIQ